jgi:hypothetical protein
LTQRAERLPVRDLSTWLVLAPGIGLVLIGVVFILKPGLGAAIFGVPAPPGSEPYLIAIGLRDVAFGLYILALALFSSRRAVGLVLALTVLIPLGDILIVAHQRGLSAPGHLMLHAASGTYMIAAALWVLRGASAGRDRSTGRSA